MKGICIFFLCFRFFILRFWIYASFFQAYIHACIQEKPLIFGIFAFWGRGLSAISTPNKRCQIKGLPLVCTILSSSPRMAPAHRFWKYGYMLPQKNSLTKISAYLGSLIALLCRNKSAN